MQIKTKTRRSVDWAGFLLPNELRQNAVSFTEVLGSSEIMTPFPPKTLGTFFAVPVRWLPPPRLFPYVASLFSAACFHRASFYQTAPALFVPAVLLLSEL
jgi:hypothetical protein